MSYPESAPFHFHRNGDGGRRDSDALPRVLLVDISPDARRARLHFAGEPNTRLAEISDLARDMETIAAMEPLAAFRVGRAAHG